MLEIKDLQRSYRLSDEDTDEDTGVDGDEGLEKEGDLGNESEEEEEEEGEEGFKEEY